MTFLLLCDQAEFGMNFQFIQTIQDPAACVLQPPGPLNIIFLIKAGTKFHQCHNFLAVFCSIDQCLNDFTVICHTVQCHFNRYDIRIFCRFIQHMKEWLHAVIWKEQEAVFLLHLFHDTF